MTSSPASECIDLNAINLSLADLKRRHESASAPYVQAWQDVGLEDDRDASVVRGRREGPNAVVGVAPERDELVNLRRDGRIERGGAVFELVQRAGPQPVLVEPRIRNLLDHEPAALHVGGDTHVEDIHKMRDVPARRVREAERLVDVPRYTGVSQGPRRVAPCSRGVTTGSTMY